MHVFDFCNDISRLAALSPKWQNRRCIYEPIAPDFCNLCLHAFPCVIIVLILAMKILDKYVAREMFVPFIAGFSVVLVLLVGNILYNNIGLIVSKLHMWPDLLYYIFLQTPYFVMLALPAGALFGCSLAVSRLARDSEISMMRMAGISVRRIFLPIFAIGILISILAYAFQEGVTVWAERESVRVLKKIWLTSGGRLQLKQMYFSRQKAITFTLTL